MIHVTLTQKSYSDNILNYLINRPAFKIVAVVLLVLILFAGVLKLTTHELLPTSMLIVWAILWCLYMFLIPLFIKKQSATIYDNSAFLHEKMTFEFSPETITWTTSVGSRNYNNIYKLATTSTALVVLFSRYQVIPIPYSNISSEDWTHLRNTYPALNSKYYQKFQDKK